MLSREIGCFKHYSKVGNCLGCDSDSDKVQYSECKTPICRMCSKEKQQHTMNECISRQIEKEKQQRELFEV